MKQWAVSLIPESRTKNRGEVFYGSKSVYARLDTVATLIGGAPQHIWFYGPDINM